MKIVLELRECQTKLSPKCTKTFEHVPRRGRPFVSCLPCREAKPVKAVANSSDRVCGCGATFTVAPGRGRKATKCVSCREAGKVYRQDDDGIMQEVQAEQLAREERERRESAGKERALLLCDMMKTLTAKTRREVIVH
jgi:hypothetical protein